MDSDARSSSQSTYRRCSAFSHPLRIPRLGLLRYGRGCCLCFSHSSSSGLLYVGFNPGFIRKGHVTAFGRGKGRELANQVVTASPGGDCRRPLPSLSVGQSIISSKPVSKTRTCDLDWTCPGTPATPSNKLSSPVSVSPTFSTTSASSTVAFFRVWCFASFVLWFFGSFGFF